MRKYRYLTDLLCIFLLVPSQSLVSICQVHLEQDFRFKTFRISDSHVFVLLAFHCQCYSVLVPLSALIRVEAQAHNPGTLGSCHFALIFQVSWLLGKVGIQQIN